jgi:hypothetical protein
MITGWPVLPMYVLGVAMLIGWVARWGYLMSESKPPKWLYLFLFGGFCTMGMSTLIMNWGRLDELDRITIGMSILSATMTWLEARKNHPPPPRRRKKAPKPKPVKAKTQVLILRPASQTT